MIIESVWVNSGYPTPHPDSESPQSDIQFLAQKVNAGADFIITQLFYDVEGFLNWVGDVRAAGELPSSVISPSLHCRALTSSIGGHRR
jgi:5,10-methylenetetrahydrofolate reductase